jgi:hypothetical protein
MDIKALLNSGRYAAAEMLLHGIMYGTSPCGAKWKTIPWTTDVVNTSEQDYNDAWREIGALRRKGYSYEEIAGF